MSFASPGSFYNTGDQVPGEVEDYLRLYPEKEVQVKRTLSYFDPFFFAPNVRARTLLLGNPEAVAPLAGTRQAKLMSVRVSVPRIRTGCFRSGGLPINLALRMSSFLHTGSSLCWFIGSLMN